MTRRGSLVTCRSILSLCRHDQALKRQNEAMTTSATRSMLFLGAVALAAAMPASAQPAPTPLSLKAPDGITLKATYYSSGKPGPGLVLLHRLSYDGELPWER